MSLRGFTMLRAFWKQSIRRLTRDLRPAGHPRSGSKPVWHGRFSPRLETLGDRIVPAVTALFLPGAHTLTVFGDSADNTIIVSRDAAGAIRVNDGAVRISGG